MIFASGPQEAREHAQPIFDCWVLTVVDGVAEMIAVAEGLGLDPNLLLDAIEGARSICLTCG